MDVMCVCTRECGFLLSRLLIHSSSLYNQLNNTVTIPVSNSHFRTYMKRSSLLHNIYCVLASSGVHYHPPPPHPQKTKSKTQALFVRRYYVSGLMCVPGTGGTALSTSYILLGVNILD